MKNQKTVSQQRTQTAQSQPANGAAGAVLTPPTYGIDLADQSVAPEIIQRQPAPNRTGLPDDLKSGVEALSGLSLDDVRVHYDSPKPDQIDALAYAQGADIHVASGQEHHLPHEAWHVVQQKQGRVPPTIHSQGQSINDNPALEREADELGASALSAAPLESTASLRPATAAPLVIQGEFSDDEEDEELIQDEEGEYYLPPVFPNRPSTFEGSQFFPNHPPQPSFGFGQPQPTNLFSTTPSTPFFGGQSGFPQQQGSVFAQPNPLVTPTHYQFITPPSVPQEQESVFAQPNLFSTTPSTPFFGGQSGFPQQQGSVFGQPSLFSTTPSTPFFGGQSGFPQQQGSLFGQTSTPQFGIPSFPTSIPQQQGSVFAQPSAFLNPTFETTSFASFAPPEERGSIFGQEISTSPSRFQGSLFEPRKTKSEYGREEKTNRKRLKEEKGFGEESESEFGLEESFETTPSDVEDLITSFDDLRIAFYSDVDDQNHEVYPAFEQRDVIIESNPTPLDTIIAAAQWQAFKLNKGHVNALKILQTNATNAMATFGTGRSQVLGRALRKALRAIAKYFRDNLKGTDLPPVDLSGSTHYRQNSGDVEGIYVKADPLSLNSKIYGHGPHDGRLMTAVRKAAGPAERKAYKQMHLLNDNVFGPGELWNLTPGTAKTNTNMESKIEDPLKRAIIDKGLVMTFEAIVNYTYDPNLATDTDIDQDPAKYLFKDISFKAREWSPDPEDWCVHARCQQYRPRHHCGKQQESPLGLGQPDSAEGQAQEF